MTVADFNGMIGSSAGTSTPNIDITVVPESSTVAVVIGVAAFFFVIRRRP